MSLDIVGKFKQTDPVKILYNVGATLDLSTGGYIPGMKGDMILCGGLAPINGITGPGNSFKSALMHFIIMTVLDRYKEAMGIEYDTEGTLTLQRLIAIAAECAPDLVPLLTEMSKFILTDMTQYDGGEFFTLAKELLETRSKGKEKKIETPFLDPITTKPISCYAPLVIGIDSYSLFQSKSVQAMQDNEIGDKSRNMEYMRDGAAKTAMLMELPTLAAKSGSNWIMSAHLGERPQMDPMQPLRKQLAYLKANLKLKNVPEKFMFLTNNLWYMENAGPLLDDQKGPKYPRNPSDNMKGDTDLMVIRIINLRPKSGPAGVPLHLVVSQRDGILRDMTHFYYIKEVNKDYGFGGHNRGYFLNIYPELTMARTQVRKNIETDPKFRRALEITSELCQYFNLNPDIDASLFCTPEQLYTDIKAMGYDWDILLQTRGYWTFDHYTNPVPPLSTLDLINMRAGIYRPWWYDEFVKSNNSAAAA